MEVLTTTDLAPIHELAEKGGFGDWDVIIAGDGSGSGWEYGCAWACVLVDRELGRQRFRGTYNFGTVAIAEIMPYIQALDWYEEALRRRGDRHALVGVHIVSDSKFFVDLGRELTEGGKPVDIVKNHPSLWASLLSFEARGFVLHFHHIPRVTWALNAYVDDAARILYEAHKLVPWPVDAGGEKQLSIYDCNADHDGRTAVHDFEAKPPKSERTRRKAKRRRRACQDDGEE